jgi:hypothetical protein
VCDLEVIGAPSILRVIHNAAALARMLPTFDLRCEEKDAHCSGTDHGRIAQADLLNLHKSDQFPDDPVRIKDAPVHYVNSQTY